MYEKPYTVPRTSLKTKLLILAAAVPGLLLTITMLAFIIVAAEDPDATTDVTFDNQTGQTTYVYIDDRVEATVPEHLSLTTSVWQGHLILGHRWRYATPQAGCSSQRNWATTTWRRKVTASSSKTRSDGQPSRTSTPSSARSLTAPATFSPSRSRCVEMAIWPWYARSSANVLALWPRLSVARKRSPSCSRM